METNKRIVRSKFTEMRKFHVGTAASAVRRAKLEGFLADTEGAALTIPVMWAKMNQTSCPHIGQLRFCLQSWACGAAGSALPWHGRGRRFDPDQVHQISPPLYGYQLHSATLNYPYHPFPPFSLLSPLAESQTISGVQTLWRCHSWSRIEIPVRSAQPLCSRPKEASSLA